MKGRSLAIRMLSLTCLMSIMLLGSWTYWTVEDMRASLLKQKEEDVQLLLTRNADYLKLYAEGLSANLLSLGSTLSALGGGEKEILSALDAFQTSSPGKLLTVYCALEGGEVLCTREIAYEVFGNGHVAACLSAAYVSSYRGIRWTEPYVSPLSLNRTIALFMPVTISGQRAAVIMEINLATLLSPLLRATSDVSPTWAVVSSGGQLVATSDDYTTVWSDYEQIPRAALESELPALRALPLATTECTVGGEKFYSYWKSAVCLGWSLATFVKTRTLYAAVRPLIVKTLLIGALHLMVLSVLIAWLGSRLTKPITRIARQLKEAESPLSLSFGGQTGRGDEIGVLTSSLDSMIRKIRQMDEEKEETQRQRRLLEIEVLQAQIHPHFMGNTLACIQSLIKDNKLSEAQEALVSLVKLFNYSIARTDDEVSLGDELKCAAAYVQLRQMRKNYSFDYQVFVPAEHLSHPVPRLFLQPIIENCIVHGFAGLPVRGVITVTGYECGGKLFLCVDDNGNGETGERLAEVTQGTLAPSPLSHGIGVGNVFKRLRLRRPEATGCAILPREGGGVRVLLDLGYI